jgi:hypothetical protein
MQNMAEQGMDLQIIGVQNSDFPGVAYRTGPEMCLSNIIIIVHISASLYLMRGQNR